MKELTGYGDSRNVGPVWQNTKVMGVEDTKEMETIFYQVKIMFDFDQQ